MALQKCGLNLNRVAKELQPHGSLDFPCAGYSSHHLARTEDIIPWHWHEEIELIYISHGRMRVKTSESSFVLNEGDLAAINANTLHFASASPEGTLCSLVFSPLLITGNQESAFSTKYIQPLLSCRSFTGCQINSADKEMISAWFKTAFEAIANDSCGFEFTVRENLSRICFYLYKKFEPLMDAKTAALDHNNLRIRKMLDYIHKNFADNISLPDISGAADISERECLRCFKKMLQVSPVQYLLKYRIMQGAELLLSDPSSSISEIASGCGFDSPSNFAKTFKRFYRCTPREYRNNSTKKREKKL